MTLPHAIEAHQELSRQYNLKLAVLNFPSIRPLDGEAILRASKMGFLISVEDHHVDTGLGARVATVLADQGEPCRLMRLGVKNYGLSGHPVELYRLEGIDAAGIVKAVLKANANGWLGK
jgi:transketolase